MDQPRSTSRTRPVFRACVRCGYSLRGLPANHACPECGLRFDEGCALYRVTNPKQVLASSIMILAGGWVSLKNLPHLANFAAASAWDKIGALAAALWIVFVIAGTWFIVRRYRQGYEVAVTTDGLIIHLPALPDDLIPWADIARVELQPRAPNKPQTARVHLSSGKTLTIGGVANVFADAAIAEDFVTRLSQRLGCGTSPKKET